MLMPNQDATSNQISGLLNQQCSLQHFNLDWLEPAEPLQEAIEFYWLITWDLRDKPPYEQANLPHPSQHIVIDTTQTTGVFGINTGVFHYTLQQTGRVFGVKFRPGAFADFFRYNPSQLLNTHESIEPFLNISEQQLISDLREATLPKAFAEQMDERLLKHQQPLTSKARNARALVELIAQSDEINNLTDLSKISGTRPRTIQRLFQSHVGVNPKWVIERYRMLAAVDAINQGQNLSLTDLAHSLGYFDHAHFSRAFKKLTGHTPSHYLPEAEPA
ncbi:transcriptional regulator, AraC family [Pseudovibrio sp. FO-BEG1]|uniref:helix-turn-helix domain-containing protein n=1 Tax=Pseudovibrio sp. (strain FO-BEG1) TaxID=911045 RepID=UPI000238D086|nr:helix-turn-helix domain-containing protein [Pseudovibrio sp. FO-BEG1]AEV39250.1 transcriptional regulator, AraC family [Pseudovibrio sp. FO-BEG1]